MLPLRSLIQTKKTPNPADEKIFTTYQDDLNSGLQHGNLVKHYGNAAYLADKSHLNTSSKARPFLAPSYHNLISDAFISNSVKDYYSNNFRTSNDNVLKRPMLTAAPVRTKLNNFYQVKTAPIAKADTAAIYEAQHFDKYVHDHFVSNRPIKNETQTLRDIIVSERFIADFFRVIRHFLNLIFHFMTTHERLVTWRQLTLIEMKHSILIQESYLAFREKMERTTSTDF
jgi:hypothetical protein